MEKLVVITFVGDRVRSFEVIEWMNIVIFTMKLIF